MSRSRRNSGPYRAGIASTSGGSRGAELVEHGGEGFQALELPGGAQGDVHLVGAGVDIAGNAVDELLAGADEHTGSHDVGDAPELLAQRRLVDGEPHVDGAPDLGRVAA